MKELNRINNVIIFDGINEYNSNEIFADSKLTQIYNNAIGFKGLPTLINKINLENGLVYIFSNPELNITGRIEVRNVSQTLQDEYSKIAD
ncbi:hypothetical protein [Chryseobacterium profundimaris]|uniref:Uncharacterized protein n=1 Tax=Chryseobacterium profundimaris TaxID=1387275 RepID=A0ABY1NJN4_9FLAO|nr:hypothetical protein [Chryseobacterium profundimaris]SMP11409.1 hypothetical protein SAMN06264346_102313 [Chryseobacterium profundimaris]